MSTLVLSLQLNIPYPLHTAFEFKFHLKQCYLLGVNGQGHSSTFEDLHSGEVVVS